MLQINDQSPTTREPFYLTPASAQMIQDVRIKHNWVTMERSVATNGCNKIRDGIRAIKFVCPP